MNRPCSVLVALLLVAGCSSSEKPPAESSSKASTASSGAPSTAKPAAASSANRGEQVETIVIKKGDKRTPEAAYDHHDPGKVSLDVKNADLEKMVLPLFSKQAGVTVEYSGPPRRVDRFRIYNEAWREVLGLLCQFTQTHVVRSQVAGRLELKPGYADPAPFLAKWDPNDKTTRDEGQGVIGGGGSSGGITSSGGSSGSSGSSAGYSGSSGAGGNTGGGEGESYRTPSQDYADKVDQIRRGVNMNNSGVK